MHQPHGFIDPRHSDYVYHLQHSLYGLSKPHVLGSFSLLPMLYDLVFNTAKPIPLHRGNEIAYSLLYELGSLNYFLGISAEWTSTSMFFSHSKYVECHTFTRPDISYDDHQVCLYMHDPREPYYTSLKCILRYIRGTIDHRLQLHVSSMAQLTAYTDADLAEKKVKEVVDEWEDVREHWNFRFKGREREVKGCSGSGGAVYVMSFRNLLKVSGIWELSVIY
nr:hypothetical protein [Tanacetum cinerariifolium]